MSKDQLHIAHGSSGAAALRLALDCPPSSVLAQHDPLSVGPLRRVEDLAAWSRTRGAFWGASEAEFIEQFEWDVTKHVDALADKAICIWIGTGAADQLMLPWVVRLVSLAGLSLGEMSVVQFRGMAGRKRRIEIIGLGMLSPENIAAHPPAETVSADGVAELRRTWSAVTAPDPTDLLQIVQEAPGVFPLLHRAVRTGLDRFPDRRSGLSHWDEELLKHTRLAGPVATRILGDTLAGSYEANYPDSVGDAFLFDRLLNLGREGLIQPALAFEPGEPDSYRGWKVRLTEAGEAFLRGERNFVEVNGIDEWAAGVHLDSRQGSVWFRQGDKLIATGAV